jgi:hypothetical protein
MFARLGRRLDSPVAFLDHHHGRRIRLAARDHHGFRRPTDTTDGPVALTMVEPRRKHGPFDIRYRVPVNTSGNDMGTPAR